MRAIWQGPISLKDPAFARLFGSSRRTTAGPVVTELTAMMCAAFYDGVNQLSSDVAKLPLNLHKRRKGGGSDHYNESKTYKLLKYAPNPETTSMVFRRTLTMHALVYGNGYAEIGRDKFGRPAALWLLEPWRVEPFYDTDKPADDGRRNPLRYRVDGEDVFEPRDILHIQALGDDGIQGFNMVSIAREALGLALASQQFAAAFFGNGTRFGGVLSSDQDLDDEQAEDIRKKIEALHAKADKAFRLLVLGAGFKFTESGVKPNEAQMKEIREQQVAEIARFLNMPPHKLKELSRSTNNNIEHQDLEYYKGPILNWITLWEEELNAKLVPSLEVGLQYFKHNANAFLRGTIKERFEALGIARDKGIINADEWREFEDWNPQEGGQGKLYLVQKAQVPLSQLTEIVDAEIAKTKQAAKPKPAPTAPAVQPDDRAEILARAERAEQTRDDALAQATEAREKLISAEATGTATAEQLAALRESESRALAIAATLTEVAESKRVEYDAALVAHEALTAQLEARALEAEEAHAKAADAMARADLMAEAAEAARAQLAEESAKAAARSAEADQRAIDALAQMKEARALMAEKVDAHLATASEESRLALEEANRKLAEAENIAVQLQAHAEAREAQAAESRAKLAEAEAAIAAREDTHKTELEAIRNELAEAIEDVVEAQRFRDEFEARLLAAEAEAKAQRTTEAERMTATIAAHRALIVDALGRMTRRECEQARAKQATPEKLRRWVEHFGATHEAICIEALTPAMRTHLAWLLSNEDPVEVTTALVRQHIDAFKAQIRLALDSNTEDFHANLERILVRWESERAAQVADAVLVEEIKYVREQ